MGTAGNGKSDVGRVRAKLNLTVFVECLSSHKMVMLCKNTPETCPLKDLSFKPFF